MAAPHCCPTDTRWWLLRNILDAINNGPPGPSDVGRITEEDDARITEEGDGRITED